MRGRSVTRAREREPSRRTCARAALPPAGGRRTVLSRTIACVVALSAALTGAACGAPPEIVVETSDELVTSERGTSVTVTVRLARPPRHPVTVHAESSDPSEGKVSGDLRFDIESWDDPRTLTITGIDDEATDGDVPYRVTLSTRKGGKHDRHDGREVLELVNRDDDLVVFRGIGDLPGGAVASEVTDMSASGEVVVGQSQGEAGPQAVRWSASAGLTGLGGVPGRAESVSPNGMVTVGIVGEGEGRGGVIWRGDGAPERLIGPEAFPSGPEQFSIPEATVALDDGRVYGSCVQYAAYGQRIGCRYEEHRKVTLLGPSVIYAGDAEGNVGGTSYPFRGPPIGSVAVLNARELGYPERSNCVLPHDCHSAVRAFTAGAAIAVGTSLVPAPSAEPSTPEGPLFDTAFVYTADSGMLRLADLEGGIDGSAAYAISADGRVIAGFGTDDEGQHAVVWVDRKPLRLDQVIEREGGSVPAGWSLLEIRAMSADGLSFAGNAINPDGHREGFHVVVRAPGAVAD